MLSCVYIFKKYKFTLLIMKVPKHQRTIKQDSLNEDSNISYLRGQVWISAGILIIVLLFVMVFLSHFRQMPWKSTISSSQIYSSSSCMIISYHCAKYPQQLMWCCEIHIKLQVINVRASNKSLRNLFLYHWFSTSMFLCKLHSKFCSGSRSISFEKEVFLPLGTTFYCYIFGRVKVVIGD